MQMKTTRRLSRRSFLGTVAGGAMLGGGALIALSGSAGAVQRSDNDSGPRADPPGRGTRTGRTDNDTSDRPGRGTVTGFTDQDPGDPANRGRRCNDADPGDPATSGAPRC
jgi:hypothetical protein